MTTMTRSLRTTLACSLGLLLASACSDDGATPAAGTSAADDGDGDGDGGATLPPTTMSAGDDGGTMSPATGDDGTTVDPGDGTGTKDDTAGQDDDTTAGPADPSSSGDDGSSSTGEPGEDDTLYEVQDGTIPEGTTVTVNGIVVTAIAPNGVFAQEPAGGQYSGIFLFSSTDDGGPDLAVLAPGDVIDIVGDTDEFFGLTEIVLTAGSMSVVSTGGAVPAPDAITPADIIDEATGEPWECVLVRVEGDLVVTDTDPEAQANVNEFVVNDGSDDMIVDDFIYDIVDEGGATFAGFDVGASFTAVQGPVNFSFGLHKVAPREADDLEGYAAP
jgi:hypothetical protein